MIWRLLYHWRTIMAAGAVFGLLYAGWWARGYVERVDDLRASNAALTADLQAVRETAEVLRAHHARLAQESAKNAALRTSLSEMEGQDEPLSDLLRAAAGGLWP